MIAITATATIAITVVMIAIIMNVVMIIVVVLVKVCALFPSITPVLSVVPFLTVDFVIKDNPLQVVFL